MEKSMITIVTPTYNRAYILSNVFNSLKKQVNKSFIWMIIDDGSTDNTEQLVKKWLLENEFKIIYYKKQNGGKASALNYSMDRVNTQYYVCLDSDDIFTPQAIEVAIKNLEKIKDNDKYCGILALRNSLDGNVLGGKQIPNNITDITLADLTNKYRIRSEMICFYKTDKVIQYRFPEIKGEKFISPAYIEHKIGRNFKYMASRESYCICEYLEDGLTKNKIEVIKKNPKGYTLVIREAFDQSNNFIMKSKNCLMYIAGSILSADKQYIKKSPNKLMTILYLPLGWIAYFLRFHRKR